MISIKNVAFTACCILALCAVALAQEQPDKLRRADALYERYEYYRSALLYTELSAKKKPSVHVLARLASCFFLMNNFVAAEKWHNKLAEILGGEAYALTYGEVLLINQKFAEAAEQFKKYYGKNTRELAAKLAQCDSAAAWTQQKSPGYQVWNYKEVNSEWSDWGTVFYKDSIVFVSDRIAAEPAGSKRYPWTNNGFLKLYKVRIPETGAPDLFDAGSSLAINKNLHYGPMAFSASGDTAYLTVTTALPKKQLFPGGQALNGDRLFTRRLELFIAIKKNGKWTEFKRFPYSNVNAWSVGHAALSPDGSALYFTSDMPGGQGKTDIWYCVKQANGAWGRPVNCGKTINTKAEEAFPSFSNGKLFFASKGHFGMGGYDIFEASGSRSAWSAPVNLKFPVNSTYDDFSLVTRDGNAGYFSSNRMGGTGNDDVYRFSKVMYKTDTIPHPGPYDKFAGTPSLSYSPLLVLRPGATFVLENIYYDLDKWNIRPDAAAGLDKLVILLNHNPSIKIALSSHTDSRARDDYNLVLSQKRAEAAVQYLVEKGIAATRLTATGFGETQLVNNCANGIACTKEQHQQNRRTEIKVLSN